MKQKLFLADGTEVKDMSIWENKDGSFIVGVNGMEPGSPLETIPTSDGRTEQWIPGRIYDTFVDVDVQVYGGFDSDFLLEGKEPESNNEKND